MTLPARRKAHSAPIICDHGLTLDICNHRLSAHHHFMARCRRPCGRSTHYFQIPRSAFQQASSTRRHHRSLQQCHSNERRARSPHQQESVPSGQAEERPNGRHRTSGPSHPPAALSAAVAAADEAAVARVVARAAARAAAKATLSMMPSPGERRRTLCAIKWQRRVVWVTSAVLVGRRAVVAQPTAAERREIRGPDGARERIMLWQKSVIFTIAHIIMHPREGFVPRSPASRGRIREPAVVANYQ